MGKLKEIRKSTTIVIATRNAHKVEEIRAILGEKFDYRTLNDFAGAPKVVEDANTFAGNATKKAAELAQWLGENSLSPSDGERAGVRGSTFVLADDSGLEIDALGGAPGVHSARFALPDEKAGEANLPATNALDAANNAKLLGLLKDVPLERRTARFRCVLALTPVVGISLAQSRLQIGAPPQLRTELFEGVCEGRISVAPSGNKGFGYDPLFVPLGHEQSFAELGEAVKNQISHRARALQKLKVFATRRGCQKVVL